MLWRKLALMDIYRMPIYSSHYVPCRAIKIGSIGRLRQRGDWRRSLVWNENRKKCTCELRLAKIEPIETHCRVGTTIFPAMGSCNRKQLIDSHRFADLHIQIHIWWMTSRTPCHSTIVSSASTPIVWCRIVDGCRWISIWFVAARGLCVSFRRSIHKKCHFFSFSSAHFLVFFCFASTRFFSESKMLEKMCATAVKLLQCD